MQIDHWLLLYHSIHTHRRMSRGGTCPPPSNFYGRAKSNAKSAKLKNFGKILICRQQFGGEILMFSLPVRANNTVPPRARVGPYAHVHTPYKLMSYYNPYLFIWHIGFTTDGEFNSLRTNGKNRPVSVIEVIKNSKKKATSLTVDTISKFFAMDPNGTYFLYILFP
jgi:hypothetical protein